MSEQSQEDLDLAYTRDIRRKIVDEQMSASGEARDIKVVLQALDGIDRQALTKMKIKSDEGMNSAAAMAVGALATLFLDPRAKKMGEVIDIAAGAARTVPELPADLPMPEILPGEMDAGGGAQENYDTFMSRMAEEANKAA